MDHTAVFEEQVPLTPKDLRNEIQNIDSLLEQKLQAKLEGRCSRHGYVLPGSLQILSRSMGMVEKGRFTGSILFHVQAEGQVLNPPDGLVVEGEVIRKNKMGIYVNYQDAIRIIVPRDLNIGNDEFESVAVGEVVKVEIKKSRFQVNDEYILSVGLYKGRGKASAAAAAAMAAPKPNAKAVAPTTTAAALAALEEEEEEGAAEGVVAADQAPLEEEEALEEAEPEFPADA
jgi:DNA-directed RNA polymerase subunit E'/Rpb7